MKNIDIFDEKLDFYALSIDFPATDAQNGRVWARIHYYIFRMRNFLSNAKSWAPWAPWGLGPREILGPLGPMGPWALNA